MSAPTSPDDVGPLLDRAAALADVHRWPQVAEAAQRALAASPQEPQAWCLLAQARLGLEDVEGCVVAARRAAALAPESEWPHRLASIALTAAGRRQEALDAAREAVRCGPDLWQAHVQLASVTTHPSERAGALRQALRLAPEVAAVHMAAGVAALEADRRDRAEAAFRRALAIDPQLSAAHAQLARLQLRGRAARPALSGSRRLAAAAGGLARAVGADPHASASREDLDLVLRVLVGRVFRMLLVAGVVGLDVVRSSGAPAARLVPAAVLVLVALHAGTSLRRLPPDVRAHVVRLVRRRHLAASVLAAASAAALLASAVVPRADAVGTASAGYALAFWAVIGFRVEASRARRAARRGR